VNQKEIKRRESWLAIFAGVGAISTVSKDTGTPAASNAAWAFLDLPLG